MQWASSSPKCVGNSTGDPGLTDPECELCIAARTTEWFHDDSDCWVAECESCCTPMVVWKRHDPAPPEEVRVVLLAHLHDVVMECYGYEYWVDENMRSIPTHYHAHARPRGGFYGHGLRRG
jgi:hypothetical protein